MAQVHSLGLCLLGAGALLSSCGGSAAEPASTPTPNASKTASAERAKCWKSNQNFEVYVSLHGETGISRELGLAPTSIGTLRFIEMFRTQIEDAEALGCDIDSSKLRRSAEALAQDYWAAQEGVPSDLQQLLEPSTAAWILTLDPREQEAAMGEMIQTVLLFKAANRTTTIVYQSPSLAASSNNMRLESEIRSLKTQLIAAGIVVH
jgi:hypothetical protein